MDAISTTIQCTTTRLQALIRKQIILKQKIIKMKLVIITALIAGSAMLYSFCGFYVSKADGTLKNKTSQVILVRDGNRTVITMYNDFQGDFKDFAMVVPVPVVFKKQDIKVVDQNIFTTLNEYSKPRLVEYYDQDPCMGIQYNKRSAPSAKTDDVIVMGYSSQKTKELGVRIEAKYLVGEYD